MKILTLACLLGLSLSGYTQSAKVSTIDFVQILNDNREEAIYYYENNWLELRKMALERSFIDSYEIIEVGFTDDAPFHLILKTTYASLEQHSKAEERFTKLIEEKGALKLLNDKKPGDFRKVIFNTPDGKHLF